jgi:hypothetical protein
LISVAGCSLSAGRAVGLGERRISNEACVLLRLQANATEASFLVAYLARRIFRWQARTLHSNQLVNEENKKEAKSNNFFEKNHYQKPSKPKNDRKVFFLLAGYQILA